ncbi:MAG: aspartate/glutamate racemase family protein [Ruminococcaceae bacterium]|nr:aspartate/glutamate racemase family protein [Oscillospiraceae bacterium]
MKQPYLPGILGGLGPMSTFYFCELLTKHTLASCDADHLDLLVSSRASTPDRTAFILGKSKADPLPAMIEEARRLADAGASLIVIPCNTAHFFYDGLQKASSVPILNIISETVRYLKHRGIGCFGLLATEGTVASGAYHRLCEPKGIRCIVPSAEDQAELTSLIYDSVKQNRKPDLAGFRRISQSLLNQGCECLVLGCTELSLLRREGLTQSLYVDSLEVLAYRTLTLCQKPTVDFPADFSCMSEDPL